MRMPKSYAKLRQSLEAKAGHGGLFTKGKPETSILLLSDVQRESGLDDDALATGLSLLHDLGVILWYEYSSTPRDYVFTNPGWIVDHALCVSARSLPSPRIETQRHAL